MMADWWMITFTPSSSDQMIRNLSMKIGEVDSGSARLLCAALTTLYSISDAPFFRPSPWENQHNNRWR